MQHWLYYIGVLLNRANVYQITANTRSTQQPGQTGDRGQDRAQLLAAGELFH